METAVGKSIDRENVAIVLREPVLELFQCRGVAQFARGLIAQAQAYGVRFVRADALTDSERMGLQRLKSFGPILAAMDVRAIGEVQAVVQLHQFAFLRKSTFALRFGVRKWSGLWICTLSCSVPFWRSASGAISATWPS